MNDHLKTCVTFVALIGARFKPEVETCRCDLLAHCEHAGLHVLCSKIQCGGAADYSAAYAVCGSQPYQAACPRTLRIVSLSLKDLVETVVEFYCSLLQYAHRHV
eukprot:2730387-Amphidinium_carterae.1